MHTPPLLTEIVIIFLISIIVSVICTRIRIPATVGFLLTGVLCGPSLLGIVEDTKAVDVLAELGVTLLLFTIGLQLSADTLSRLKKPVFFGGSLQVGLTILGVMLIFVFLLKESVGMAVFIGCILALSNTSIVLPAQQSMGLTNTPTGNLTLSILVFQDIMVAPMMLLIPFLSGNLQATPIDALWAIGKIVVVLGSVLLLIHLGLNRVMAAIVRTRVSELLLLSTLGFCLGLGFLTSWLGLSLSLGAFLAGVFLARSQYSMSVVSGILPYRDVFMSIFFVSIGMLLNVDYLIRNFHIVFILTAGLILIKTLLIMPAVLLQKYPLRTALAVAITISQIGEFSFVLATEGHDIGLLTEAEYQSFLAMSIISMVLTPSLVHIAPICAKFISNLIGKKEEKSKTDADKTTDKENHLIIVGFGLSGQHLAHAAKKCSIPYEILEMNPDTVNRFKHEEPILYGDASRPIILEHLGIAKAKVLAIIISDPAAVQATVAEARKLNPNICIIARTRFLSEVNILHKLGADEVVAEEFETSVEVFSQVLHEYMIPKQDIDALTNSIRKANYSVLRCESQKSGRFGDLLERLPNVSIQAVRLDENSTFCGKSLAQTELGKNYGVTVVAIEQNGEMQSSPTANTIIQEGNIIYIFGKDECIQKANKALMGLA